METTETIIDNKAAVNEFPPDTDTINNSVPTGINAQAIFADNSNGATPGTSTQDNTGNVSVSTEQFELLQLLIQERRDNIMKDKAKLHSKIFSARRITVALRRINLKSTAPDQDVVAYIEICNLKSVAGDKSEASEEEMAAYLEVFYAGNTQPTLEQIKAAVK